VNEDAAPGRQKRRGFLLTRFALRLFMHEAIVTVDVDPDRWSLLRAVGAIRRTPPRLVSITPSVETRAS
jgi:hypothetical protein